MGQAMVAVHCEETSVPIVCSIKYLCECGILRGIRGY